MSKADDCAVILATLARYSTAMDARDWGLLEEVFTEDLVFDAGEWTTHSRVEFVVQIRPYLEGCGPTQHLLGNHRIEPDGDQAHSAIYVRAFHVGAHELSQTTYEMFGEYRDVLVRTDSGWKIRHRTVRLQYELGSREVLRPA